jgi:hypothetical protein
MGLAGALSHCSGEDAQPVAAGGNTSDVNADCRDYCAAQDKAACTPPFAADACLRSCLRTVEAHGACGESWRALMRCIAQVGLTCTPSGPQANGCSPEFSGYSRCLAERIDGGSDAAGQ